MSRPIARRSLRGELDELDAASRRTFNPKVARWIVGIAAVSLIATLLLSTLVGDEQGAPADFDAHPNSYSKSALGHQAFAEVMRALDLSVVVSRYRSAEKATRERPLWIVEPEIDAENKRIRLHDLVARAVQRGVPTVVVLPKWQPSAVAEADWVKRLESRSTANPTAVLDEVDQAISDGKGEKLRGTLDGNELWRAEEPVDGIYLDSVEQKWKVSLQPVQALTTSERGPLQAVIEASAGESYPVLVARFTRAPVWIVSDPDLLNTMGVGQGDHAVLLYHLITVELGAQGLVIDEVSHGFMRAESIWSELFRFPLVLATFHFAGLFALVLWASLLRFGKPSPRPPRVPSGKSTLLDNTATLLALGHNAGHGVREYFSATLRAVARVYGLPTELTHEQRLAAIVDLAKRKRAGGDLEALAAEAATLRDERKDERRALVVARKIHAFRTEMIDGPHSSR